MEAIGKLLDYLGYATPALYAAAAYGAFAWLDKETSDEAKATLAKSMKLKSLDKKQVAEALVEVFDRIYTHPLLSWRALFRSMLLTFVVTIIFVFESLPTKDYLWSLTFKLPVLPGLVNVPAFGGDLMPPLKWGALFYGAILLTNVLTDYVSLFIIRPWLVRCGIAPVFALVTATLLGVIVVNAAAVLRAGVLVGYVLHLIVVPGETVVASDWLFRGWLLLLPTVIPAMAVFVWLPLFAVGILAIRAFTAMTWLVEKAQWALKGGEEHPLRATGYVAALVVFVLAATLRAL